MFFCGELAFLHHIMRRLLEFFDVLVISEEPLGILVVGAVSPEDHEIVPGGQVHLVEGELFPQFDELGLCVCFRAYVPTASPFVFLPPSFGVMGLSSVGIPVGKFPNQIPIFGRVWYANHWIVHYSFYT